MACYSRWFTDNVSYTLRCFKYDSSMVESFCDFYSFCFWKILLVRGTQFYNTTIQYPDYNIFWENTIGLWQSCSRRVPEYNVEPDYGYTTCTKDCKPIECSFDSDFNNSCIKIKVAGGFMVATCILCGLSILSLYISVATAKKIRRILIILGLLLSLGSIVTGIVSVVLGVNGALNFPSPYPVKWGGSGVVAIIGISINLSATLALVFIDK